MSISDKNGAGRVAIFVEMAFATGVMHVWSGTVPIFENGIQWGPVGGVGRISALEERADLGARSFTLQLAMFAAEYDREDYFQFREAVRRARDTPVLGRAVRIFGRVYGVTEGIALEGALRLRKAGVMSAIRRNETAEACSIEIVCEDMTARFRKASNARLTDADQQARFPGDRGLEFAAGLGAGDGRSVTWIPSNP